MNQPLRNILIVSSLLAILIQSCVEPNENDPVPQDVYVKYYGASGSQRMADMIVNQNQNVVMFGIQRLALEGANSNYYLVEADSVGNEIRSNVFDVAALYPSPDFATEEVAHSIKEIANGYLIVGNYSQIVAGQLRPSQIFWAHLNQNLEIIYSDTIHAAKVTDNLIGRDIILTNDGNVVITGSTSLPEINDRTLTPLRQYFLIKKNLGQDTTYWRKSYGYSSSNDEAIALYELAGGNLAVIGNTSQIANGGLGGVNVGIMVLNSLATSQVSDEIYGITFQNGAITDTNPDDLAADVIRTPSGFLIVGTTTLAQAQRPFVMGILENGGIVFSRMLQSKHNIDVTGRGITQTLQNDLVVTGAYPRFLVNDPTLAAPDKNGEVLFMRTGQTGFEKNEYEGNFGLVSGNDIGVTARTLSNGSILIGGTIDFGSNLTLMALIKLNDRGTIQK